MDLAKQKSNARESESKRENYGLLLYWIQDLLLGEQRERQTNFVFTTDLKTSACKFNGIENLAINLLNNDNFHTAVAHMTFWLISSKGFPKLSVPSSFALMLDKEYINRESSQLITRVPLGRDLMWTVRAQTILCSIWLFKFYRNTDTFISRFISADLTLSIYLKPNN